MALYLVQVAYTPQAWATMTKNPQDRMKVLKPVLDKLGGRVESSYFTFGDYDFIAVLDLPGNVDAAAFAIAGAAGGAVKALKTTPLLSTTEGLDAMRKATTLGYTPPQG